jgi:crossover junction endodeoxyribonuclease RuvC
MMKILGVDPGLATAGFGLISAERGTFTALKFGVITTPAKVPFTRRLDTLFNDLTELLLSEKPDAIAIEELFFGNNVTTGIAVSHARGVLLLAAVRAGVPAFEYTPNQVKQSVAGYGGADKKQVQAMVARLLALNAVPRPDDAADALALALCHGRAATSLMFDKQAV